MIGIFGSAFNPPTLGHKDVLIQAASQCEKIILLPSASHAFGKSMLPYEIRCHLLMAFTQDIVGNIECPIEVSTLEQEMLTEGINPIYTFDVLDRLSQQQPSQSFAFILGPDNAKPETWQKFYKHEEIDQRWSKIICQQNTSTRSTLVRESIQQGLGDQHLLTLVTPSVLSIIKSYHLYQDDNRVDR